jgi:hypothetical protein
MEEARFLGTFNLAWVNSTFLYPYFLKVRKGWSLIGGKASWNFQPGLGQLYPLSLLSEGKERLGVLEETGFLGTFNLAWVNSTFLYPYFLNVRKDCESWRRPGSGAPSTWPGSTLPSSIPTCSRERRTRI